MNAICLVFDRLHAGYVGAYGNAWIDTPGFDRLAGQSFVFDQALIDTPELEGLYRSYWQGWHALCPTPPESRPTLAGLLGDAGVTTALLTDEPAVARHPLAGDFQQRIDLDPPWEPQLARKVERTHFGRCFVQIIDWLESARGPFLLWCHLGGLGTTWDAPLEFRRAYRDAGDPPPPDGADVPELRLPTDYDPDLLLGISQAYAGQVTLLDTCLGAFCDFLDGLPGGKETLLVATSARGFPLGEHGRVGPCDGALYGETVHVPWMMRLADSVGAAARSPALVEPADLWASLLEVWGLDAATSSPTAQSVLPLVRSAGASVPLLGRSSVGCEQPSDTACKQTAAHAMPYALRDRLCIAGTQGDSPILGDAKNETAPGQRAIRTPAWFLRDGHQPELYAKPDDRWEVNNVASRCREVVECLRDALGQYELAVSAGRSLDLPALGEVLVRGLD
jgi:hypothetical protein